MVHFSTIKNSLIGPPFVLIYFATMEDTLYEINDDNSKKGTTPVQLVSVKTHTKQKSSSKKRTKVPPPLRKQMHHAYEEASSHNTTGGYPLKPDEEFYRKRLGIKEMEEPPKRPKVIHMTPIVTNGPSEGENGNFSTHVTRPKRRKPVTEGRVAISNEAADIQPHNILLQEEDLIRKDHNHVQKKHHQNNSSLGPMSPIIITDTIFSNKVDKPTGTSKKNGGKKAQNSINEVDSMLNTSSDRDMFRILTSRSPGYLLCPSKQNEDTPTDTHVIETTAVKSLPMAVRQFYVSKEPPKVSTARAFLGDELQGGLFVRPGQTSTMLHMRDGEIVGTIDKTLDGKQTKSTKPVSRTSKENILFGNQLGTGQSIDVVDNVIQDSNETTMDNGEDAIVDALLSPGGLVGDISTIDSDTEEWADELMSESPIRERSMFDTASIGADDQIMGVQKGGAGSFTKKPYGNEGTAVLGQEYLYTLRHTAEEMGEILGQFGYRDNFGMPKHKLEEMPQFYANISVRTRASEENFLREPIGNERACVEGDACEGNFICAGGFTLVEYPNPEDTAYFREYGSFPPSSKSKTCVMCSRNALFFLYSYVNSFCQSYKTSMINPLSTEDPPTKAQEDASNKKDSTSDDINMHGKIQPLMLCNYTNLLGPGEYSVYSCITSASSQQYKAVPGVFIVHNRLMFTLKIVDGVKWFIQHYPKPIETPRATNSTSSASNMKHGMFSIFIY